MHCDRNPPQQDRKMHENEATRSWPFKDNRPDLISHHFILDLPRTPYSSPVLNTLGPYHLMYRSNRSFNMPPTPPPRAYPGHLTPLMSPGIWLSEFFRGWGIWSPCFRGGEFEPHPRFHVKSLAWRAIMGDAVLEDFRGKDCAFVANCLRGKGLNKLCAVFEVFKF